jgi:Na+-driven multidrug efflux pump
MIKEILSYTGWNVIGIMSGIGKSAGVNVLLNMFGGAIINTARGIAYQVYVNINQFVTNFTTAFNPQITKTYSANARDDMQNLVFQSSKFSYFLLFLLALPVILEMPYLLDLWLGEENVVAHSVSFARLMLIAALIDSISYPLVTSIQATGNVKWYQIMVGGTMLMVLPVSYILLKFGNFEPEIVFYIIIAASVVAQVFRVYFMRKQLDMHIGLYCLRVLLPIGVVTIIPLAIVANISANLDASFGNLVIVTLISMFITITVIAIWGLTPSERKSIIQTITNKIKR